ncbi:MAG: twin-arginine translocation signal domain-containing protein, partial [candidate division NC10 bacterium]
MKRRRRSQTRSNGMTRREVLRLGATAAAGVAFGPFVVTPARAQAFNWQRFRGKELYCIFY